MQGLIRASLNNHYAVMVLVFTLVIVGSLTILTIPIDILPVSKSPAVQVLTFYGGMSATTVEKSITNRMERWTGQAAGTLRQESRSIVGASIIRNYYRSNVDPNGALTQVASLASAAIPNLPPGTLPPVILPFDPTSSTPVCLVALDSEDRTESELYDTGRYEVRNMIMASPGAVAPVVYGGKVRAVIAHLNREQLQSRNLSPLDVMDAIERFNLFLPTGSAKFGNKDYALDSNSMVELVEELGEIPLRTGGGRPVFLSDVATPRDTNLIQTNLVRVNGRRQVYIPVYRQVGSSTLNVVDNLQSSLADMKTRLTLPGIDLRLVMDQSVYVRTSVHSLAEEGILGAFLCSLVILVFLGEWRMTVIAVLTVPISVLVAITGLHASGNTLNVMTLAGLALAIGPLIDSAIIALENTHRHLEHGQSPRKAAFLGASEVALPGLVAGLSTLLVLAPLALMPGLGEFLFRPLALAVAFCMVAAYLLSWTFVPALCSLWLQPHQSHHHHSDQSGHSQPGMLTYLFHQWSAVIQAAIRMYLRLLALVLRYRRLTLALTLLLLVGVIVGVGPRLRREFFPEVDTGSFEIQVRAPTGTRLEVTEQRIAQVEEFIREQLGEELDLLISELGVTPDWSAAYTPNAGPMDAVLKVQLKEHRTTSAQQAAHLLREGFQQNLAFTDLEFAFDSGGMVRAAMNDGKSTPINIRITGRNLSLNRRVAERILEDIRWIEGVVDARILQRLDYPQYVLTIDRAKAANLGLTQADVMRNVVAAVNSSIQFNKKNFWIDPISKNQYYVGVSYPEKDIKSLETLLQVPLTGPAQHQPIPLGNLVSIARATAPAELIHNNLQQTIDLTMNVHGRDLGRVADEVEALMVNHGQAQERGSWMAYDPASGEEPVVIPGCRISLSGEYSRMQDTFRSMGVGLGLASLLVYFLMVALFRSWLIPLIILSAVPVGLIGVVLALYLTGSALNVQSLLGVIFMVGIVVSNTVLLIDFAQGQRFHLHKTPTEAILEAARIRVLPVVMTGLAAFFALMPMALGLARGSEANTPLGRSVIGGLVVGMITTLIVVPALYSLMLPNEPGKVDMPEEV
ncbi:MAG: efflux RND transporter permease subunit [Gemmataceae bacterium]